jgi:hypothetical protein
VCSGGEYRSILAETEGLLAGHYRDEGLFLKELACHAPKFAAKMEAQHNEVFEYAGHIGDALVGGQTEDALRLVRRFHALAQHNIIEEERDVFPLAARCFEF